MDLFRNKIWSKGAWICNCKDFCNGSPIRFSAGIGWHHHTRNETLREKLGFDIDDKGWRI